MVKIKWTPLALSKVENICSYFDEHVPEYSFKFIDNILNKIQNLKQFPKMGRMVLERGNPNLRELIIGNYRVIYRLNNDEISLITVLHCRQDFSLK